MPGLGRALRAAGHLDLSAARVATAAIASAGEDDLDLPKGLTEHDLPEGAWPRIVDAVTANFERAKEVKEA